MKWLFILCCFLGSVTFSRADEVVRPNFDEFFHTPTVAATEPVLREFECIRSKVDSAHSLIRQPRAWSMIKKFSGRLEKSFQKLGFTDFERALFYSQILAETGGFTHFSETKDFKAGQSPMEQLVADVLDDARFEAKKDAKKSAEFGQCRGRGLVQVSRCDNLISAIHYMNLEERGREPKWLSDWTYKVAGQERRITTTATPEDIKAFESEYRMRFGMDADAYGVLREPRRASMTDVVWQDKTTQKSISSEQLMVNISMAYWRGRCGPVLRNVVTPNRLAEYELCQKFAGGSYLEHAIKCLTYCVRGTTDGWQERLKWMGFAMACVQGGVLRDKAAFQK